ncbi:MAG: GT2 family glycosyltransferase [Candidatus Paceibacteria bacterium]|jgi:GT2 family glycosyltransferase
MKSPISIVIPTLEDAKLLERCISSLQAEVDRRGVGDEILCVDDTGQDLIGGTFDDSVRVLPNSSNLGFARAALAGARAATHELLFLMNPDVILRPGALDALSETLEANSDVHAVAPYVLLNGEQDTAESVPELVLVDGIPQVARQSVVVIAGQVCAEYPRGIPVAFALGGACLMRRSQFIAEPFDERFEPFYWEDVDLGKRAWNAGKRVLVDPRAVAEHHHRGTIASYVPAPLVRAAIEKNRLLYAWKHLQGSELEEHLHALSARVMEHSLAEDREELEWLVLALESQAAR